LQGASLQGARGKFASGQVSKWWRGGNLRWWGCYSGGIFYNFLAIHILNTHILTIVMRQSSLSIEHGLLGFLRREPKHGYAIHQELADPNGLGQVWQIKLSRLYALLGKLEDAGFITATIEPQENKPSRKLFQLTKVGERAFEGWLQSPVRHGRSLRLEFLVKLYFAGMEGADEVARLLAAQRELCRAWLAAEQEIINDELEKGRRYSRLVHQFRSGQILAMLDWLDQCEAV
jgi:DNA-binding PadR family transcriptional regulator